MKHLIHGAAIMGLSILWCLAEEPQFEPGIRIEADGRPIDVNIGHLVPCVTDWNGDGRKDLIVGQFDGGKIRLYLNQGADSAPQFKNFSCLQAAGKDIRLDAG